MRETILAVVAALDEERGGIGKRVATSATEKLRVAIQNVYAHWVNLSETRRQGISHRYASAVRRAAVWSLENSDESTTAARKKSAVVSSKESSGEDSPSATHSDSALSSRFSAEEIEEQMRKETTESVLQRFERDLVDVHSALAGPLDFVLIPPESPAARLVDNPKAYELLPGANIEELSDRKSYQKAEKLLRDAGLFHDVVSGTVRFKGIAYATFGEDPPTDRCLERFAAALFHQLRLKLKTAEAKLAHGNMSKAAKDVIGALRVITSVEEGFAAGETLDRVERAELVDLLSSRIKEGVAALIKSLTEIIAPKAFVGLLRGTAEEKSAEAQSEEQTTVPTPGPVAGTEPESQILDQHVQVTAAQKEMAMTTFLTTLQERGVWTKSEILGEETDKPQTIFRPPGSNMTGKEEAGHAYQDLAGAQADYPVAHFVGPALTAAVRDLNQNFLQPSPSCSTKTTTKDTVSLRTVIKQRPSILEKPTPAELQDCGAPCRFALHNIPTIAKLLAQRLVFDRTLHLQHATVTVLEPPTDGPLVGHRLNLIDRLDPDEVAFVEQKAGEEHDATRPHRIIRIPLESEHAMQRFSAHLQRSPENPSMPRPAAGAPQFGVTMSSVTVPVESCAAVQDFRQMRHERFVKMTEGGSSHKDDVDNDTTNKSGVKLGSVLFVTWQHDWQIFRDWQGFVTQRQRGKVVSTASDDVDDASGSQRLAEVLGELPGHGGPHDAREMSTMLFKSFERHMVAPELELVRQALGFAFLAGGEEQLDVLDLDSGEAGAAVETKESFRKKLRNKKICQGTGDAAGGQRRAAGGEEDLASALDREMAVSDLNLLDKKILSDFNWIDDNTERTTWRTVFRSQYLYRAIMEPNARGQDPERYLDISEVSLLCRSELLSKGTYEDFVKRSAELGEGVSYTDFSAPLEEALVGKDAAARQSARRSKYRLKSGPHRALIGRAELMNELVDKVDERTPCMMAKVKDSNWEAITYDSQRKQFSALETVNDNWAAFHAAFGEPSLGQQGSLMPVGVVRVAESKQKTAAKFAARMQEVVNQIAQRNVASDGMPEHGEAVKASLLAALDDVILAQLQQVVSTGEGEQMHAPLRPSVTELLGAHWAAAVDTTFRNYNGSDHGLVKKFLHQTGRVGHESLSAAKQVLSREEEEAQHSKAAASLFVFNVFREDGVRSTTIRSPSADESPDEIALDLIFEGMGVESELLSFQPATVPVGSGMLELKLIELRGAASRSSSGRRSESAVRVSGKTASISDLYKIFPEVKTRVLAERQKRLRWVQMFTNKMNDVYQQLVNHFSPHVPEMLSDSDRQTWIEKRATEYLERSREEILQSHTNGFRDDLLDLRTGMRHKEFSEKVSDIWRSWIALDVVRSAAETYSVSRRKNSDSPGGAGSLLGAGATSTLPILVVVGHQVGGSAAEEVARLAELLRDGEESNLVVQVLKASAPRGKGKNAGCKAGGFSLIEQDFLDELLSLPDKAKLFFDDTHRRFHKVSMVYRTSSRPQESKKAVAVAKGTALRTMGGVEEEEDDVPAEEYDVGGYVDREERDLVKYKPASNWWNKWGGGWQQWRGYKGRQDNTSRRMVEERQYTKEASSFPSGSSNSSDGDTSDASTDVETSGAYRPAYQPLFVKRSQGGALSTIDEDEQEEPLVPNDSRFEIAEEPMGGELGRDQTRLIPVQTGFRPVPDQSHTGCTESMSQCV